MSEENMDSLLTGGEGGWGLRARDVGYGRNGIRFTLTVLEDRGKYWLYLDSFKLLQLGDYGTEEISG